MRRSVTAFVSAICVAIPGVTSIAAAQVTIEALQGSTWGASLTIPTVESMKFRWKYESPATITAASWQVSFTSPDSATYPPVVKSVSTTVPAAGGQYASFDIAATALPANPPSRFYVRIRSSSGISPWLPVTVAQRAVLSTSSTTQSLSGALSQPIAPTAPFTIPGGGSASSTPLWIRLNHFSCESKQVAYVIVASVHFDAADLAKSSVMVRATAPVQVCDNIPDVPVVIWGPTDNSPEPIRLPSDDWSKPSDNLVLVSLMKRQSDHPINLAVQTIHTLLLAKLKELGQTADYSAKMALQIEMDKVIYNILETHEGDYKIGTKALNLTLVDLQRARNGELVNKLVEARSSYGTSGAPLSGNTFAQNIVWVAQQVWFQLGKEGVAPKAF